jgi:hypothetical protein
MDHARTLAGLAAAAALLAASTAQAQSGAAASTAAGGSVTVLEPVAIGQTSAFASAVVRPTSGAGAIDMPGATYTVTGLTGETFNVTAPASIKLSRVGGADEIEMTLTPSQVSGQLPGRSGLPGQTTIGLRGSAPVDKSTPNGSYVGKYGLTVAYP